MTTIPLTNESMHRLADIIADHGDAPLSRAVKAAFPLPSPQSDLERWGVEFWDKGGNNCEYRTKEHFWGPSSKRWLPLDDPSLGTGINNGRAVVLANPPTVPPPNFKENACSSESMHPSNPSPRESSSSSASDGALSGSELASPPACSPASPADAEPVCPIARAADASEASYVNGWNNAATAYRPIVASLRAELTIAQREANENAEYRAACAKVTNELAASSARERELRAELERVKGERDANAKKVEAMGDVVVLGIDLSFRRSFDKEPVGSLEEVFANALRQLPKGVTRAQ